MIFSEGQGWLAADLDAAQRRGEEVLLTAHHCADHTVVSFLSTRREGGVPKVTQL